MSTLTLREVRAPAKKAPRSKSICTFAEWTNIGGGRPISRDRRRRRLSRGSAPLRPHPSQFGATGKLRRESNRVEVLVHLLTARLRLLRSSCRRLISSRPVLRLEILLCTLVHLIMCLISLRKYTVELRDPHNSTIRDDRCN